MRPFLGLPVSQKKRNVRSSRSAKNGSRAPVASAVGVAQWPVSPKPPAARLGNGGVGALPVSQKKRNVRSSRSAKNGSTATGSGGWSTPIESGVGVAQWPVSPKPAAAMLANGGVGALPVSQKKRNVRSSRSAKNGSTATGSGGWSTPIESGAGVAEWPVSPYPPAAMLASGGVGALPVSQKKRKVRASRSATNGSRATGSGGRSTPIESGAGVAGVTEWPAAPARPDNKAQHATSSGNTRCPRRRDPAPRVGS